MREITVCYTKTSYELHTFKNKNKRNLLRDILVYHFVFYICLIVCKFAIIETRAYDIAHDESAMSSLIIQSIYYGQVQPLVFLKVLQYSQENTCVGVSF